MSLRSIRPDSSALLVGAAIGAVLAACNVYTGLTTAYVDGGSITAVILGYACLRARGAGIDTPKRLDLVQATASSAAVMVGVIGLAGPWPALHVLGRTTPAWILVTWGLALGVLGVALAHALRARLIVRDRLPFPTGAATAQVAEALASDEAGASKRKVRTLLVAVALAAAIAYAQQGQTWLPGAVEVTLVVFGAQAILGVGLSPLVVATGALVGVRTAIAMAVGGAFVWLALVPWLQRAGAIASGELSDAVTWLMWPAMGLLVGEVIGGLASERGTWRRAWADLAGLARTARSRPALLVLGGGGTMLAAAVLVVVGRSALGVPVPLTIASLVLAVVLSVVVARAAGETDVAPVGTAGTLGQLMVGAHGPVASLAGGSIPCGLASQTAQGLWILAAGDRLRSDPRRILGAQLLGVVVGTAIAVPVYQLLVATRGIGTEAMPAWAAVAWAATAQAVQHASAPTGALVAGIIALVAGLAIALRRARRADSRLPSPTALAIGALTPLAFSNAVLLGALLVGAWRRLAPSSAVAHAATVAAACLAGEALLAIALALVG